MSIRLKITVVMLLCLSHLFSQTEYKISNTETKTFQSELLGEKLELIISYPFGYSKSDKKYPVLFVLDADVMFGSGFVLTLLLVFVYKILKSR